MPWHRERSNRKRETRERNCVPKRLPCHGLILSMKVVFDKVWHFITLYLIAMKWELIELFTSHKKFKTNEVPNRPGEVVIVTGGGRGIGAEVVKAMLKCGKHVIIGCRNPLSGIKLVRKLRTERVTTGSAECLYLDLASLTSVREFAHKIVSKNVSVSVLVNNAGVMFVPFGLTEDRFECHFQVNFLSHFLLTNLLLPRMISCNGGQSNTSHCARIINVSSCAHYGGSINFSDLQMLENYSPYKAYMNSKLMQVVASNYLDKKMKRMGINVRSLSVHPAIAFTDLYENVSWFRILKPFVKPFFRSAEQGADGIAYACLSPRLENQGGVFLANCKRWKPNTVARSAEVQHRLWEHAAECVNLNDKEAIKFGGAN